MNEDYRNPLQRDGIIQNRRLLEALKVNNISIDGRDKDDLKNFAEGLAVLIRYWDSLNETDNQWKPFFKIEDVSESSPHYALFLTFLELFGYAQKHLNTLTKKHLDFYYKEVLRIKEKVAKPDQVHVVFELAKNIQSHNIKAEDLLLSAGKDNTGKELFYKLNKTTVINKAQIKNLKSVFVDNLHDHKIYIAPFANSANGQGKPFEENEPKWNAFGESQWVEKQEGIPDEYILKEDVERTMQLAELGFACASPLLFLKEGNRKITITLKFLVPVSNSKTEEFNSIFTTDFVNVFTIYLSGEKGWIGPYLTDAKTNESGEFTLGVTVSKDQPAITPYDKEVLGENYNTKFPVIKFLLNQEAKAYHLFKDLNIESIQLDVDIQEVYDLILQNDKSKLDSSSPFHPFGSVPLIGSNFYIGSAEVFQKKLSTLSLNIEWENAPLYFSDHYGAYPDHPNDNSQFRAEAGILYNKSWHSLTSESLSSTDNFDIYIDKSAAKNFRYRIKDDTGEIILNSEEGYSTKNEILKIIQLVFAKGTDKNNYELKISENGAYYFNLIVDKEHKILARSQQYYDTIEARNIELKRVINYLGKVTISFEGKSVELFDLDSVIRKKITFTNISDTHLSEVKEYGSIVDLVDLEKYNKQSQLGFMKLNLVAPNEDRFTAFGHKEYTAVYTKATIELSNYIINNDPKAKDYNPPLLPNGPYTPVIKSLSIDYSSSETILFPPITKDIELGRDSYQKRTSKFFHIGPFGQAERYPYISLNTNSFPLLPQFHDQGNLYIGIESLVPPQVLNILFQVAEGTANPDVETDVNGLKWSYISSNQWIPFSDLHILSDETNGMQTSGIIAFDIPNVATADNTIMPANLHWLRASINSNPESLCQLIALKTQVATVSFADKGNDPAHLQQSLKANTISKLAIKDTAIKSVSQPFSSFGGASTEQGNTLYTRVSERLRHKNRAITIWDFERLVLEKFPSIYKVRCLNHTNKNSELTPGSVSMIVIQNVRNKNAVNPLQPKTSRNTLIEIEKYLQGFISPFVNLEVQNPIYEEVLVDFTVGFKEGIDPGYHGQLLNEEIKKFLSPWAYDEGEDMVITGKVHKSTILKFIEDKDYVDFVNQFRLYHIKRGVKHIGVGIGLMAISEEQEFIVSMEESEVVEASNSRVVLVSAENHNISVMREGDITCKGGDLGIGHMMVDVNFEVN